MESIKEPTALNRRYESAPTRPVGSQLRDAQPASGSTDPRRARMIVAGTPVDLCTRNDVITSVYQRLSQDLPALALGSVNLDHIHHFGGIEKKRHHLNTSRPDLEWILCADGMPIVERANELTEHRWPRITGADLLPDILETAETQGCTVGFLGGTSESHHLLRRRLDVRFPGLVVNGWWSPDRFTIENGPASRHLATEIASAKVDVLVVGLGKPRQELWIERFGNVTGAKVLLAFGAASDFLAGTSKRAPEWVGNLGMEWAYRLAHEPKRLAHRYLREGPEAWLRLRGAFLVADSDQDR